METQKIKTAIIVLNWNGIKWLEKFLPTLVKNSKEGKIFIHKDGDIYTHKPSRGRGFTR